MTTHSATLAIDEAVTARRDAGQDVLHLGFGEAGLPVPPGLAEVLADAHARNGYGPVAGSPPARAAAAGWFTRRGLPTEADQILFAPGSKPLLFALLAAIGGDVVLPRPAWVSYAAQAALLGRRVVSVPIPAEAGGIPDPERLERDLGRAVADGARPGVLVLTVPDNPTGTVAPAEQVEAVCRIAERHGLAVISDEIYAELSHDAPAPSPARYLAERTVVTTGLSKSLALGGWRIGFSRLPAGRWGRRLRQELTGVASEIWSSLAAPMQAVAAHALDDPPEITAHIAAARRLHARVAHEAHVQLLLAGAHCRRPQAGFYLYPDFAPLREALRARGIDGGGELATALLDRHGVATLPGSAFGEPSTALTLRIATSLLYGATRDQRQAALAAAEPETLPWIAPALTRLGEAFEALR
ncbi:aminotransferase class I/II-fold pyridoxal phosphate-dependent enzyme [Streptomyces sp. 8K308]|uniref:pyridoxal phosphate-dependent aminotransferase n=1 Tax=Streptomyces sp. 8K308 TaxID=2530388 RepID=UPI00104ED0E3|nr:aminotransferase class I/II-fold pyridoxal phosphate-dependent enzyme [Streptomyces sp. 8K308]TDC25639.1 aminotransferase class I/II-fold pyridoxal phosphate-dependent enzyme [Streptomyces sp. 8K308]